MRTGQDAASTAARLREEWKPGICEVSEDVAPLDAPDFLAAERTGGEAFKSPLSNRFMVRFA